MQNQATSNARTFARSLRREMTDGERLLWQRLRGERLGVKFRRQHPVGPYVADFACLGPQLIVEVDGWQHAGQQAYDAKRDAYFRSRGFDVLRFPANVPFIDLPAMVQAIHNRVAELAAVAPIPAFPQRGRSKNSHDQQATPSLVSSYSFPLWGKAGMGATRPPIQSCRSIERCRPPSQPSPRGGRSLNQRP